MPDPEEEKQEQPEAEQQPQAQPAPQPQRIDPRMVLIGYCYTAMSITVRGTVGMQPQVPGGDVVEACCRAMGMIVGTSFHGTLHDVLMRRKACREAFLDGLAKSPPPPMQQAPVGAPMTVPRPGNGHGY